MKKTIIYFGLMACAILVSCKKNPESEMKNAAGEIVKMTYLWHKDYHGVWNYSDDPKKTLVYNDAVITTIEEDENLYYTLIDAHSGEIQWKHLYNFEISRSKMSLAYTYKNYLLIPQYSDIVLCDLTTGNVLSSLNMGLSMWCENMVGINHEVFMSDVYVRFRIKKLDILTQTQSEVVELSEIPDKDYMSDSYHVLNHANKTYFAHVYSAQDREDYDEGITDVLNSEMFVRLYNCTDNVWEYTRKIDMGRASQSSFFLDSVLICKNQNTGISYGVHIVSGDVLWKDSTNCIGDELVSYNSYCVSTTDSYGVIAKNCNNGTVQWNLPNKKLSFLHENKGVLYGINTDGYKQTLWAIDILTGKVFWNIESPNESPFTKITCVPGTDDNKAHIVAETENGMYCYSAFR